MSGKKVTSLLCGILACGVLAVGAQGFAEGNSKGNGKNNGNGYGNGNGGGNGNGNGNVEPIPRCFGPRARLFQPYRYNPASSTMVKGVVESIDSINYPDGPMVHVKVNTDEGIMMVVLGPAYYYNKSNIALQPGDQVQIAGSSVYGNGEEVIIATEVKKNGRTLQLRDSQGRPFWKQRGR